MCVGLFRFYLFKTRFVTRVLPIVGIFLGSLCFYLVVLNLSMSAPPTFTKEDFALWNQTTSVFHLPKRLVGKSKVPQLWAELVKTIGEKRVSAVQALPDFKFRVCFPSPSVCCAFDINGLNFQGLTITAFPAYEQVKAVFPKSLRQ